MDYELTEEFDAPDCTLGLTESIVSLENLLDTIREEGMCSAYTAEVNSLTGEALLSTMFTTEPSTINSEIAMESIIGSIGRGIRDFIMAIIDALARLGSAIASIFRRNNTTVDNLKKANKEATALSKLPKDTVKDIPTAADADIPGTIHHILDGKARGFIVGSGSWLGGTHQTLRSLTELKLNVPFTTEDSKAVGERVDDENRALKSILTKDIGDIEDLCIDAGIDLTESPDLTRGGTDELKDWFVTIRTRLAEQSVNRVSVSLSNAIRKDVKRLALATNGNVQSDVKAASKACKEIGKILTDRDVLNEWINGMPPEVATMNRIDRTHPVEGLRTRVIYIRWLLEVVRFREDYVGIIARDSLEATKAFSAAMKKTAK